MYKKMKHPHAQVQSENPLILPCGKVTSWLSVMKSSVKDWSCVRLSGRLVSRFDLRPSTFTCRQDTTKEDIRKTEEAGECQQDWCCI